MRIWWNREWQRRFRPSLGIAFFYMAQDDPQGPAVKYILSADPVTPGTSGVRHFFTDESGVIRSSMAGSADVSSEPLD